MEKTVVFRPNWQPGMPAELGIGLGVGGAKCGGGGRIPGWVQIDSCAEANAVPPANGCAGEPPNAPALLLVETKTVMEWGPPSHGNSDSFPYPSCMTLPATTSLSCTLTFWERDCPAGTVGVVQVMWTGTPTAAPRAGSSPTLPSVTISLPPAPPVVGGSEAI